MSEWTWKQAVAEEVLKLANFAQTGEFTLRQLYRSEFILRRRFPHNRHVREKMRQTLQRLRDMGFVEFHGAGKYRLNLKHPELELIASLPGETGIEVPGTRTVVRSVRLRNTLLAAEIKRRYANTCQVCRTALQLARETYAEAHHLKPLGSPHYGPDKVANILVLCPNHHIMFDRGALRIEGPPLVVIHESAAMKPRSLYIQDWHVLSPRLIQYHNTRICGTV